VYGWAAGVMRSEALFHEGLADVCLYVWVCVFVCVYGWAAGVMRSEALIHHGLTDVCVCMCVRLCVVQEKKGTASRGLLPRIMHDM
jgi:hypothetical protein